MPTHHELFPIMTDAKPSFLHVTDQVEEIVARSGIRHAVAIVYSQRIGLAQARSCFIDFSDDTMVYVFKRSERFS